MPRQGEDFHRLVEYLERAVSENPNVTIESPKLLSDKITGNLREHDIVLTYQYPQRQFVIAIECRDRSRKVGVAQVEEFYTKCRDTGVHKGVIVASRGFADSARKKASYYDIDCLMFAQVDAVEWCAQDEIAICQRDPTHVGVNLGIPSSFEGKRGRLFLRVPHGPDEEIDLQVASSDDGIVCQGRPDGLTRLVWPQVVTHLPDSGDELSGTIHVEIANHDAFYILDEEGITHEVGRLYLDFTYEVTESKSMLAFYRYGEEFDRPVYETLVTSTAAFGDIKGRIMIIRDESLAFRAQFVVE